MFSNDDIEIILRNQCEQKGETYTSLAEHQVQVEAKKAAFDQQKTSWVHTRQQMVEHANAHAAHLPAFMAAHQSAQQEREAKSLQQMKATLEALPVALRADFNKVDWANYTFETQLLPDHIVSGYQTLTLPNGSTYPLPVMQPFMATSNCFIIKNSDNYNTLNEVHDLVLRLNTHLPYTSQYCLLDPANSGKSFLYNKNIPHKRMIEKDISRVLEEIEDDSLRIRQTYLDQATQRLHDIDETIRSNERFEFIIAANFPSGYDRRAIELLASIANNAADTGKYVILHLDKEQSYPNGTSLDLFKSRSTFYAKRSAADCLNDGVFSTETPSDTTISAFFDSLSKAKPQERKLAFSDVVNTHTDSLWQGDASRELRCAIGGSGSRRNDLEIWFGESKDGRNSAHGMLGATTGAGKSYLYHAFIMGLACQYSPDELQFYLIDGKQGVEFQSYPKLPHAKVVSLKTSPQLARSVVAELVEEMERRNEMFQQLGVTNFTGYRDAGSPNGKLPRVMLIVDEYQVLFEDDREGLGSELMYKLAAQARSAGIHMFVGSQRFGAPGMQKQQHIFGNIHLRVGMKMTAADVTALQEFGHNGKRLLRACKEPGQAVINDGAGDDERNIAGRVAFLDNDTRIALVDALSTKWQQQAELITPAKAILLDGAGQPELADNPQLAALLNHAARPDESEWMAFAAREAHQQGLEEKEWYPIESPSVFWLGQELNIHGHARAVLRRRPHEHLLFVGDSNEARLGMLGSVLSQLPVNFAHDQYRAVVYDRSVKGSPWHGVMAASVAEQNSPVEIIEKASIFDQTLTEIIAELDRRKGLDEDDIAALPSIFVVLNETQRATELQMQPGRFGVSEPSPATSKLVTIIENGAELGIHLIVAIDSVRALQKMLNRTDIDSIRHKVALQMSEDDSFALLKMRHAAQLQLDGKEPINALYIDQMQNRPMHFKPYCYRDMSTYQAQVNALLQRMENWG
ncbi:FtsK/SpoIIIE domain-containing protein [Photobacterium nomapromontoriensis]|uniref:FtsK/SpoIIIE domain-containing protein n=1 Tax=Photobacterium nomapromontoriensis TaxID=2910237 RepID=UPI003D1162A6